MRNLLIVLMPVLLPWHTPKAEGLLKVNITFSEAKSESDSQEVPAIKPFVAPKKQWHELHGNIDGKYVYLMVKKVGQRQIEGYLFDGHGKSQYIYGEWFNKQLQIYNQDKVGLTVILQTDQQQ